MEDAFGTVVIVVAVVSAVIAIITLAAPGAATGRSAAPAG
jgi:hypothetical protein